MARARGQIDNVFVIDENPLRGFSARMGNIIIGLNGADAGFK